MYGDLKYPSDFTHFDYIHRNAQKGGTLKRASIGSFDSLTPFIVKGTAATLLYQSVIRCDAIGITSSVEKLQTYSQYKAY